jgi:hypothetical protein
MKIIVDHRNYAHFEYAEYLDGGTPQNNPYVRGQVVAIKEDNRSGEKNTWTLGVVLGCITPHEVRTDVHGMVPLEDIRPAVVTDFGKSNVHYHQDIYEECQGKPVKRRLNVKREIRREVEQQLVLNIYPSIGIDKPENHDSIVDFIVDDVKTTADPEEWHSGDISIGFRRFLESIQ